MEILVWVTVGLITGWLAGLVVIGGGYGLAGQVLRRDGYGVIGDIVGGVGGGFIRGDC